MSTEDFVPDLSGLAGGYEILSPPLRTISNSWTYLARSLELNRDVTITLIRPTDGDEHTLNHFATDARSLSGLRHRSVVPVVEGRWLADGTFAVVRARVRGSTLEETIDSAGALPASQVATTLDQVRAAIDWARDNGIVHRHVSPESIIFQQGSGRALLELGPSPLGHGGLPDACDDSRTLGTLAYAMLAGRSHAGPRAQSLLATRPDLLPEVAGEVDALIHCDPAQGPRDVTPLIALLSGSGVAAPASATRREYATAAMVPGGPVDSKGTVVKRPFGFNARMIAAVAVLVIIGTLGMLLLNQHANADRTTARRPSRSTSNAGEVRLDTPRRDTAALAQVPAVPIPPPAVVPDTTRVDTVARLDTTPRRPIAPPETRRHEPPRGTSPSTMPSPATQTPRETTLTPPLVTPLTPPPVVVPTNPLVTPAIPGDTSARSVMFGEGCDSPTPSDQRRCLAGAVEHADSEVSVAYDRVIAALRRQANVQPNEPDPPSVDAVRASHRRWLEARDEACRNVGSGMLYARVRAECYAAQSTRRVSELATMLAGVPAPRDTLSRSP